MSNVKNYILTCYAFMCCLGFPALSKNNDEIDRAKSMNAFLKESEQILSRTRDNLRKSKETLDRLAVESEEEELLRDSQARQIGEIEAQLAEDFLSYSDKAKLTQGKNEPLHPKGLVIPLKNSKRALSDILALLMPSNLRNSENQGDGMIDFRSNIFGFGGGFFTTSTTTDQPDYPPQAFRTIMRAPPPLPKQPGVGRVQSNGSVVCFSVIHVCPSTLPTVETSDVSSNSSSTGDSSTGPSNAETSTNVPPEVYLNNEDIEFDESQFTPEGVLNPSIAVEENEGTVSGDGSLIDDAKLTLDKLISTIVSKEMGGTKNNGSLFKLLFGIKENQNALTTELTTPELTLPTRKKFMKRKEYNAFIQFAFTPATTESSLENGSVTVGSSTHQAEARNATIVLSSLSSLETGTTIGSMQISGNQTTGTADQSNLNSQTTSKPPSIIALPATSSEFTSEFSSTSPATTANNCTDTECTGTGITCVDIYIPAYEVTEVMTCSDVSKATTKIVSSTEAATIVFSTNAAVFGSSTNGSALVVSSTNATVVGSSTNVAVVSSSNEAALGGSSTHEPTTSSSHANGSTINTSPAIEFPINSSSTNGAIVSGSSTNGAIVSGSSTIGAIDSGSLTIGPTDSGFSTVGATVSGSSAAATTTSDLVTASSATTISNTSTASSFSGTTITMESMTTSAITKKKQNFFLKLLYYQPTHKRHPKTTTMPAVKNSDVPFQLVILEPQILRLPTTNTTVSN